MELPEEQLCHTAVNFLDRGLIGQFTGLWPSPKTIEGWVQRNWKPLISEGIRSNLIGKGFYVFLFENSEDKDLIFRNGPYFMAPQGISTNGTQILIRIKMFLPLFLYGLGCCIYLYIAGAQSLLEP